MPKATFSPEQAQAFVNSLTREQQIAFLSHTQAKKLAAKKQSDPMKRWMSKEMRDAVNAILAEKTGYNTDPSVKQQVNEDAIVLAEKLRAERAANPPKSKKSKAPAIGTAPAGKSVFAQKKTA